VTIYLKALTGIFITLHNTNNILALKLASVENFSNQFDYFLTLSGFVEHCQKFF